MSSIAQLFTTLATDPSSPEHWKPVIQHASTAIKDLVPDYKVDEFVTMWFSDEFHTFGRSVTQTFSNYDIRAWNYQTVVDALEPYESIRKNFAS